MSNLLTVQGLYVDGSWIAGHADDTMEVINPATQIVVAEVPQASADDVRSAIRSARVAFDEGPWPRMTVHERAAILRRMGEIMRRRSDEITAMNIIEAGSVQWQAEMIHIRYSIDYWMDVVDRVMPTFPYATPFMPQAAYGLSQGVLMREPIGVAALITAYNFPFELNLLKLAPALATGCTVVLKPSPYTPLEALILGEIAEEAGLPSGVLNIVTGDIDAGTELTTNPQVDIVSFTGSDTVGRKITAQASSTLKRVVLELGGKSASIICADADLDKAVNDTVFNFTVQAGQGCSLTTRTFVHESIYDEVLARTRAALDAIKVGDPADPEVGMGPLIREVQREKVESLIRKGLEEGGELAYGGGRPAGVDKGFFVEPTLFVNVDNSSTIAQTEFFGPVGIVTPFANDEQALALANDSVYGLGGGVWSADTARAYDIARRLRTGIVIVNGQGGMNFDAPFGGYGQSGLGRERGSHGLSEFLEHKSIVWGVA